MLIFVGTQLITEARLGAGPISVLMGPAQAPAAPVMARQGQIIGSLVVGQVLGYRPAVYTGHPTSIEWRWRIRPAPSGPISTVQTGGAFDLTNARAGMLVQIQERAISPLGTTAWTSTDWLGPVTA